MRTSLALTRSRTFWRAWQVTSTMSGISSMYCYNLLGLTSCTSTLSKSRTLASAMIWNRPCAPAPTTPRVLNFGFARYLAAMAPAAAVLTSVR